MRWKKRGKGEEKKERTLESQWMEKKDHEKGEDSEGRLRKKETSGELLKEARGERKEGRLLVKKERMMRQ